MPPTPPTRTTCRSAGAGRAARRAGRSPGSFPGGEPDEDDSLSGTEEDISLQDLFAEGPAAPDAGPPAAAGPPETGEDPSLQIDWNTASSFDQPPLEAAELEAAELEAEDRSPPTPRPTRKPRPAPAPARVDRDDSADRTRPTRVRPLPARPPVEKKERVNRRAGAGVLLGLLLGGGIASGVYFSGVLSKDDKPKPVAQNPVPPPPDGNPNPPPGGGPALTPADAQAIAATDPARAVAVLEAAGADTPQDKAALGQGRLFARLRDLARDPTKPITATDPALAQARDELTAAAEAGDPATAVRATIHLGLTYELAGDRTAARKVYADAMAKYPRGSDAHVAFQAALDRLDATDPAGNTTSLRLDPATAEQLATAAVVLFALEGQPALPPPADEPPEAGPQFWKAVNAAAAGKYAEAITLIDAAKAAHTKRARALAGRGLNPLSDPLEQIFPRTCADLKAYWTLKQELYGHPTVGALVKAEGVTKALAQLAAAEQRAMTLLKTATELKAANDTLAADLKTASADLLAVTKDLKTEQANALALKKELTAAEGTAADLKIRLQKSDATIDAVAKELQDGKLLPEEYDAGRAAGGEQDGRRPGDRPGPVGPRPAGGRVGRRGRGDRQPHAHPRGPVEGGRDGRGGRGEEFGDREGGPRGRTQEAGRRVRGRDREAHRRVRGRGQEAHRRPRPEVEDGRCGEHGGDRQAQGRPHGGLERTRRELRRRRDEVGRRPRDRGEEA